MVYTCVMCKWRSDKYPRRSYHRFPSNPQLKQKWLDILGKGNATVGSRAALCSSHFEEDCFRYGLVMGTKILNKDSVPTLHLTKEDESDEIIDSNDEMKLPESTMESNLPVEHPITDDVPKTEPTANLDIEEHEVKMETTPEFHFVNLPIEIITPEEFCSRSIGQVLGDTAVTKTVSKPWKTSKVSSYDVRAILEEHPIGAKLLDLSKLRIPLENQWRSHLCYIIVIYFIKNEIELTNEDIEELALKIVRIFTSEIMQTYYVPPVNKSNSRRNKSEIAKGKLVDKYRNTVTLIRSLERVAENKSITKNVMKQ